MHNLHENNVVRVTPTARERKSSRDRFCASLGARISGCSFIIIKPTPSPSTRSLLSALSLSVAVPLAAAASYPHPALRLKILPYLHVRRGELFVSWWGCSFSDFAVCGCCCFTFVFHYNSLSKDPPQLRHSHAYHYLPAMRIRHPPRLL